MTNTAQPTLPGSQTRRPYDAPVLTDLGSVAAVTAAIAMSGAVKDGGPNNIKS